MGLRVFISHSTKTEGAKAFLLALAKRLEDEQMTVLLDRLNLEPGDNWRPTINSWVGGCNAAVLVISPEAIASHYVVYEASILAYRHKEEKSGFKLIPLLLEGVTKDQLKNGSLAPCTLGEIQEARGATQAEVFDRIVAVLKKMQACEAPRDKHVERLAGYFKDASDELLEDARASLGMKDEYPEMADRRLRARAIADRLVSEGFSDAAVRALQSLMLDAVEVKTVLDVLYLMAGTWVDPRSMALLKGTAGAPADAPVFVMNASYLDTAKVYIVHSNDRHKIAPWPIVQVDPVIEGSTASIVASVRRALGVLSGNYTVEDMLKTAIRQKRPVFVLLPAGGSVDEEMLKALRGAFKGVVFFVLKPPPTAALAHTDEVTELGLLDEETEDRFWAGWDEACRGAVPDQHREQVPVSPAYRKQKEASNG